MTKTTDFAPGPDKRFTATYSTKQDGFIASPNPKAGKKPSANAPKKHKPKRKRVAEGTEGPSGRIELTARTTD